VGAEARGVLQDVNARFEAVNDSLEKSDHLDLVDIDTVVHRRRG
jgi:hypothetical protein